jgi:hypothetical protein
LRALKSENQVPVFGRWKRLSTINSHYTQYKKAPTLR